MSEREDLVKKHFDELHQSDKELVDKLKAEFGAERLHLLTRLLSKTYSKFSFDLPFQVNPGGRDVSILPPPPAVDNFAVDSTVAYSVRIVGTLLAGDSLQVLLFKLPIALGGVGSINLPAVTQVDTQRWTQNIPSGALVGSAEYVVQAQIVDMAGQVLIAAKSFFATK